MLKENKSLTRIEKCIAFFKKYWGIVTSFVISTSIVALFTCSLVFDRKIELQIMNNWVGIILGMIATIMSIISLFLSFYNLEREREEGKENRELFLDFRKVLDELQKEQSGMKDTLTEQLEATKDLKRNLANSKSPTVIDDNRYKIDAKNEKFIDILEIMRKAGAE